MNTSIKYTLYSYMFTYILIWTHTNIYVSVFECIFKQIAIIWWIYAFPLYNQHFLKVFKLI